MAQARRKFDEDFKIGAVRIVRESGKPIAQVARELGVNEGTLGNCGARDRRARGEGSGGLKENGPRAGAANPLLAKGNHLWRCTAVSTGLRVITTVRSSTMTAS
jgi:transposase-like protein